LVTGKRCAWEAIYRTKAAKEAARKSITVREKYKNTRLQVRIDFGLGSLGAEINLVEVDGGRTGCFS
jgi:hypothetical protein